MPSPRKTSPDRERALSPETPPDQLLELADTQFKAVLDNPVLPLLLLADPRLARTIVATARFRSLEQELHGALRRLSPERLLAYALEVAEADRRKPPSPDDPWPALKVARVIFSIVEFVAHAGSGVDRCEHAERRLEALERWRERLDRLLGEDDEARLAAEAEAAIPVEPASSWRRAVRAEKRRASRAS